MLGSPLLKPLQEYECCCSVIRSCPILCDSMDCIMPGSSVLHYLLKSAQIHESVMPSNHLALCRPFPPALSLSQHQGLFQWNMDVPLA